MAEAVDYKGSPSSAVATVPAFEEETDEDRCVRILSTFGLDLSLAVASAPVDPDLTDLAAPALPLGADLVRPAPPALRHLAGVAWKVVNLPFYVIAGGMGVVLGTLRLGARAFNGALAFLGCSPGQHKLSSHAGTASDAVGTRATHLPHDILLEIACRLGPPRRNVQAMRSTCPAWRAGVPNTNGPLLIMSRLDDEVMPFGIDKMLALQMVASEGGATSLVRCPCFCRPLPPPDALWGATRGLLPHASVWGAAHGLVAFQQEGTFDVYLFCLNCGQNNVRLPRLPLGCTTGCRSGMASEVDDITSGGIFFHELPITPLAILFSGRPTMFTDQHIDDYGRRWWAFYPGTEDIPMNSVGFLDGTHFVAVSADLTVVIGPVEVTYPGNWTYTPVISEQLVFLDIPAERAPVMVPWGSYGNHVFRCGERVYVCIMKRSISDEDVVSSTVYSLDRLTGGGYALVRTYDIGDFAVYLGANQALIVPAADSMNQLANTIYIADDDGVTSTARIWSVNIASGETDSIPFPSGVIPGHYGRATWAAPPPLNMPFWHCDTTMGR